MNAYDFDETIYDGESSVEFVFAFIKHDPSVLKFIPKVMKEFVRYNKGKLTVEEFPVICTIDCMGGNMFDRK